MRESIKIIIGILLAGYFLWSCLQIFAQITRTDKPKITLGGAAWGGISLLANMVIFKLVMGCPWRVALTLGLVVALVSAAIVALRYLYYQRGR